jgi:hypothetical protein
LLRTIQNAGLSVVALILFCSSSVHAEGASLQGMLKLGGGYLENPIGLASEVEAGYISQSLRLAGIFDHGSNRFKLGYEGYASQFSNDTQLGTMRHGLGAEWYRTLPNDAGGRPGRISLGLQAADRAYEDYYSVYDYQEVYMYLAIRKYLGVRTLLKIYGAFKIRDYGNILGESYREPHGKLEIQRFFESRTTLGVAVRYGAKSYYDVAASEVWETLNLPSTSQLSTRLNISQGIGNRFGVRGWSEYRVNFDDYPHFIDHLEVDGQYIDIFDSPLLDRYAREGFSLFGAVKYLSPRQIWLEGGASYADNDYGELLFPSDVISDGPDAGQSREDTVQDYYVSATRKLAKAPGRPKLVLTGGWLDRSSTVARYTFSGSYVSGSVAWYW